MDPRAEGCNHLIRDGATLVRGAADVLAALGAPAALPRRAAPPAADPPRRPLADIAAVHGQILARLGPSPLPEDQLIRDLALPPQAVAAELVTLELEGRIERQAGGMLARVG
jgi:DNA processing protein